MIRFEIRGVRFAVPLLSLLAPVLALKLGMRGNIFALLLVVLLVATVITAIASGVVGITVSQNCLRPIHSMSRLMKEMTVSDLSARLDTNKIHTELRDVATHYNEMMDRLEASYVAQARFVSDASHELRTPLSVISGVHIYPSPFSSEV